MKIVTKVGTKVGTIEDVPAELKNFFLQWQGELHKVFEEAAKAKDTDVKDSLLLLNEIENGVADIIIYNRKEFIDCLNKGPASSPPGMVDIISSPAHVLHKVEPEEAFWVIATTVSGYIGCFDMVKTDIHFNSSGSSQSN